MRGTPGGGTSVAAGGKAGWRGVGAEAGCDRGEREKGVVRESWTRGCPDSRTIIIDRTPRL